MKIGIISDTHDQLGNIAKAISLFHSAKAELVFHLGDWCSPFATRMFADLRCPVIGIFGNNDGDIFKHLAVCPDNVTLKDRFHVEEVAGRNVALCHGDPEELVHALAESARYDAVLSGHNHQATISRAGATLLVNPGSMLGPTAATVWTPPSVALLDTANLQAEIIKL